jgi:hypothetical protein
MPVSHDLCLVPRPEDTAHWLHRQPYKCLEYPQRDCPGCIIKCSRLPFIELGDLEVIS